MSSSLHLLISYFQFIPTQFLSPNHKFVFYKSVSVLLTYIYSHLHSFFRFHMWYHMVFVWPPSLSMIITRSIHVVLLQMTSFHYFLWLSLHCLYVPHLPGLVPFPPVPGYQQPPSSPTWLQQPTKWCACSHDGPWGHSPHSSQKDLLNTKYHQITFMLKIQTSDLSLQTLWIHLQPSLVTCFCLPLSLPCSSPSGCLSARNHVSFCLRSLNPPVSLSTYLSDQLLLV